MPEESRLIDNADDVAELFEHRAHSTGTKEIVLIEAMSERKNDWFQPCYRK